MTDLIFAQPDKLETFGDFLNYANNLTNTDISPGGVVGITFLLMIFGALFLMMRNYPKEKGLAVSLLITSILSFPFRIWGLISNQILYVCIVLFLLSLYLLFSNNE